ncbi:MAG: trypsin-like serine protease, partial [Planctomycetaceae bacterium]|nr:trypsin-like serine protease [Planctomycetaceae bacterium]
GIIIRPDRSESQYVEYAKQFPAVCAVLWDESNVVRNGKGFVGSGTLVAPGWVLTAAHIVQEPSTIGGRISVVFDSGEIEVERVIVHPDYPAWPNDEQAIGWPDIALLKLKQPVEGVTPVSLYQEHGEAGQTATIIGWGGLGTFKTGHPSKDEILKQPTVRRAGTNVIERIWLGDRCLTQINTLDVATDLEAGVSGGDSGGALLIHVEDKWLLAGVVKAGIGGRSQPEVMYGDNDVFLRVSSFLPWIDSTMGVKSTDRSSGSSWPLMATLISSALLVGGILLWIRRMRVPLHASGNLHRHSIAQRLFKWRRASALLLICAVALAYAGDRYFSQPKMNPGGFSHLEREWEQLYFTRVVQEPGGPRSVSEEEKQQRLEELSCRSLALAERSSDEADEISILYLTASYGSETKCGIEAIERLRSRVASADIADLAKGLQSSRASAFHVLDDIVPLLLKRVRENPKHPQGGRLLSVVSSRLAAGSDSTMPPHFSECADLLVANYSASPEISRFCEVLGGGVATPKSWAVEFESHLERILASNKDRLVRFQALAALAALSQGDATRQDEARNRYSELVAEFDGQYDDERTQTVEAELLRRARKQLDRMGFVQIGQPVPEIEGVDLDGKPMTLTQFRGKVVLLSFWAAWCQPCMAMLPHEKELAEQLEGRTFAIVGVNADTDEEVLKQVITRYGITWRSFRDQRVGESDISQQWLAEFPTMYLIDQNGIVRNRWVGTVSPDVIRSEMDVILDSLEPSP